MVTVRGSRLYYRRMRKTDANEVNLGIRRRLAPLLAIIATVELIWLCCVHCPAPGHLLAKEIEWATWCTLGDGMEFRTPNGIGRADRNADFPRQPPRLILPVITIRYH